jgi:hypothetical protein
MSREAHVRFWEGPGVKFPRPTRHRLHHVRDMTFDEDRSQVRKDRRPHTMATLRNIAISLLRLAGAENIAAATRYLGRQLQRPLRLLGLSLA